MVSAYIKIKKTTFNYLMKAVIKCNCNSQALVKLHNVADQGMDGWMVRVSTAL